MENQITPKEFDKAKNFVIRLLKFRQRSEKEIRQRLKLKQFSDNTAETVIKYFKQLALIDDRQFAKSWIRTRLLKPFGVKRIRFELKQKGIPENLIQEALDQTSFPENEIEMLSALASKCLSKQKDVNPLSSKRRIYSYLSGRGFKHASISKAIKIIFENKKDDNAYDSE